MTFGDLIRQIDPYEAKGKYSVQKSKSRNKNSLKPFSELKNKITYNNDILWHLVNSLLVDHMVGLWQKWNMNRENIRSFEQFFK